jgi:hypothetical protein
VPLSPPPIKDQYIFEWVAENHPDEVIEITKKFKTRVARLRLLSNLLLQIETSIKDEIDKLGEKHIGSLFDPENTPTNDGYPLFDPLAYSKTCKTKSEKLKTKLEKISEFRYFIRDNFRL